MPFVSSDYQEDMVETYITTQPLMADPRGVAAEELVGGGDGVGVSKSWR
jgi:hypothetical protein